MSHNFVPPKSRNGKARLRRVASHSDRGRPHALYVSLLPAPPLTSCDAPCTSSTNSGLPRFGGRWKLQDAQTRRLYGGVVMSLAIKNLDAPLGAESSELRLSNPIPPTQATHTQDD